jgi:hypothetical protein
MTAEQQRDPNPDRILWGAPAIAKEINATLSQTYHYLESGVLDASKAGKKWVSTPRRLRKSLGEAA